jgi:O-antigen/teichoic acid export membrane protein
MIAKVNALIRQEKTKNFLLFSSASFISAFISVITLHWFTEYMPPAEFGIWSFTLTFNSFIATIIVLDLHSHFLVEAAKHPESRHKLLGTLMTFSFGWSIFMILLFLLLGSLFFDRFFEDIDFYPYIAYILVSNIFACFSLFLQIIYRIENKGVYYFLFSIFQSVFSIFVALLIVVYFIHDAEGRILGHSVGMVLSGLVALFVLWRFYSYRFTFDRTLIRQALKFSAPLIPYSIALLSMDFVDRIFIERYCSPGELGLFGLASQISTIIYFIFISLIRVYEPSIIVWIREQDHRSLGAFALRYNLLLIFSSTALMLVSGVVIYTLANASYHESSAIVIKLSPFFYLKSVSLLLLTILISGSKTVKTMYLSIGTLGLYLLGGYLFIPRSGMDGMIVVKTAVAIVSCMVTFLLLGHPKTFLKLGTSIAISAAVISALAFLILRFNFYL